MRPAPVTRLDDAACNSRPATAADDVAPVAISAAAGARPRGMGLTVVAAPPVGVSAAPPRPRYLSRQLAHQVARLPEALARCVSGFAAVEVHGTAEILDAAGAARWPDASTWAPAHLDGPGDFLLLAALWRRMPARGARPLGVPMAIARRPNTFCEALGDRVLLRGIVTEVVTAGQAHGEEAGARRARLATNRAALAAMRGAAENAGRPVVCYPEGAISDDGLIRVANRGFFAAAPRAGALVLVAPTFEPLAPAGIEVLCQVRALPPGTWEALSAADIQATLSRLAGVTLTGLIGLYLQIRTQRRDGPLVEAELQRMAEAAVHSLGTVPGAVVHAPLLEACQRARRVRHALAQLRRRGYLSAEGHLTARLGATIDPAAEHGVAQANRAGERPHLREPLAFWGNRLAQQAYYWPELRAALDEALDEALHDGVAARIEACEPQARPVTCPIM